MIETPSPVAFLDASVLYPALLRNMLMYFAVNDLYQPRWTAKVHEEWMSALLRNRPDISQQQLERTRQFMEAHTEGAIVEGYEHHIKSIILPDADDRHILAAAIHCEARFIVTANLRDFPDSILVPFQLSAEHPDAFLLRLLNDNEEQAVAAFHELCVNFKNPPRTTHEVIETMRRQGLMATADAFNTLVHAQ